MKIFRQKKFCLCLLFFLQTGSKLFAQVNYDSLSVMNALVALRNDFVGRIESMGYHPSLKLPAIIMDNPPSFGNYDDSANTLHTSNWNTMSEQDKTIFIHGGQLYGFTGEAYFEATAHKWIFIHELGHWWRNCQHQITDPYSGEMAANRLDIAYWREADTAYSAFSKKRFENYLKFIPNPVPAGLGRQKYLNDNYGKLPITSYIWYQASMIVEGYDEMPVATFKESVSKSGNLK